MFGLRMAIILLVVPALVAAQRDYFPSLRNTKGEGTHDIPLGPIGGVARIAWDTNEAEIVDLMDRGPGKRAGLQVGQKITSANGKKFPAYSKSDSSGGEGPPEVLGLAILESQASGSPLRLGVSGGEVAVKLPTRPMLTEDFTQPGALVSEMSEAAAEMLADRQKDKGAWGNDYATAFSALGLLATGDRRYRKEIERTVDYFVNRYEAKSPSDDELKSNPGSNWMVCQVGIFLAEYYLATGKRSVLPALQQCCDRMAKRIHPENGRFGHNKTSLPYGEKGLVIINTHAHLMWALAKHCGCTIDEAAWNLSLECVEGAMSGNDAIGYNFSARSGHQGGGRTGSMATGLIVQDDFKSRSLAKKLGRWLSEHYKEFPDAHAMTSMGLIYGTSGLKTAAPRAWKEHMDYYRWMFALCTPVDWDQGMYYFGQKGNHGGDSYLNYKDVANFTALMLLESYRNDSLWMFGNRSLGWFGASEPRAAGVASSPRVSTVQPDATPPAAGSTGGRLSMFKERTKGPMVDEAEIEKIDKEVIRTLHLMFKTKTLRPQDVPLYGRKLKVLNVDAYGNVSLGDGERSLEFPFSDLRLEDRARMALLPSKARGMDENSAARIAFYLLAMNKAPVAAKYLRMAGSREAEIKGLFGLKTE